MVGVRLQKIDKQISRRVVAVAMIAVLWFASLSGAYWLAVRSAASTTELCQAGNTARRQQIVLWDHFAKISKAPPHETAAQNAERLKEIASILAYIHHVFAPRNCSAPNQVAR